MLTIEQFNRTRRLALRLAGIELHERHRELLSRRCRRTRIESAALFDAMLDAAEERDPGAGRRLVNLVTTNFTGFFRHPWHFDIAAEHALWAVHRRRKVRMWCAAAATGEEPYSLAMALMEVFRRDDPPATIEATDIDDEALGCARRGEYGEHALRTLDGERRARFFAESDARGRWGVGAPVRRLVEFRTLNLVDAIWPVKGQFDVIFCRNVLMYLEAGFRRAVFERLASLLAADGLLILDPAENPDAATRWFRQRAEGLYQFRKTMPFDRAGTARMAGVGWSV